MRGPLRKLAQECEKQGMMYSGFIFNLDDQFLMHFTNVQFEGPEDIVALQYSLSALQAQIASRGGLEIGSFFAFEDSPSGPPAADKMALEILSAPEGTVPEHIVKFAKEHISDKIGKK